MCPNEQEASAASDLLSDTILKHQSATFWV